MKDELKTLREELRLEMEIIRVKRKRKEKRKIKDKLESSNIDQESNKEEKEIDNPIIKESSRKEEEIITVNPIEIEEDTEHKNMIKENKEILIALGKMKNVKAIIEGDEQSDIEEE